MIFQEPILFVFHFFCIMLLLGNPDIYEAYFTEYWFTENPVYMVTIKYEKNVGKHQTCGEYILYQLLKMLIAKITVHPATFIYCASVYFIIYVYY